MPHSSENYFAPLIQSKPNKKLTSMQPLGMDKKSITMNFKHYFAHTLGRHGPCFTTHYPYKALAHTVRDRLMERWKSTTARRTSVSTTTSSSNSSASSSATHCADPRS